MSLPKIYSLVKACALQVCPQLPAHIFGSSVTIHGIFWMPFLIFVLHLCSWLECFRCILLYLVRNGELKMATLFSEIFFMMQPQSMGLFEVEDKWWWRLWHTVILESSSMVSPLPLASISCHSTAASLAFWFSSHSTILSLRTPGWVIFPVTQAKRAFYQGGQGLVGTVQTSYCNYTTAGF